MNESLSDDMNLIKKLIYETKDITELLDNVDQLTSHLIKQVNTDAILVDAVDKKFINEIQTFSDPNVSLCFGETMRELKCVISDEKYGRKHEMWLRYDGPKMLRISNMTLPHSSIQDRTYKTLEEVIKVFWKYLDELSNYLKQMDLISTHCTVMEPVKPTYKEDFRKIYIANRIWLHVEVFLNGSMKNLNLINPLEQYKVILEVLLLNWNYNMDIAMNVMTILDSLAKYMPKGPEHTKKVIEVPECLLCLHVDLLGDNRVPLPLCTCDSYYHRSCLLEWFVIRMGARAPSFGVPTVPCPCCRNPIRCSEKD